MLLRASSSLSESTVPFLKPCWVNSWPRSATLKERRAISMLSHEFRKFAARDRIWAVAASSALLRSSLALSIVYFALRTDWFLLVPGIHGSMGMLSVAFPLRVSVKGSKFLLFQFASSRSEGALVDNAACFWAFSRRSISCRLLTMSGRLARLSFISCSASASIFSISIFPSSAASASWSTPSWARKSPIFVA